MFDKKKKELFDAVFANDNTAVLRHLNNGVSPNFERATVETVLGMGFYMTPLFAAVKNNNTAVVTALLCAGADPNFVSRKTDVLNTVYISTLLASVHNHTTENQHKKEAAREIYIALRRAGAVMYAATKTTKALGPAIDSIRLQLEDEKIRQQWFWLENEFEYWKTEKSNKLEDKWEMGVVEKHTQNSNSGTTEPVKRRILI